MPRPPWFNSPFVLKIDVLSIPHTISFISGDESKDRTRKWPFLQYAGHYLTASFSIRQLYTAVKFIRVAFDSRFLGIWLPHGVCGSVVQLLSMQWLAIDVNSMSSRRRPCIFDVKSSALKITDEQNSHQPLLLYSRHCRLCVHSKALSNRSRIVVTLHYIC